MAHHHEKSKQRDDEWLYSLGSMVEPSETDCPPSALFQNLADLDADDGIFEHLASCAHCQWVVEEQRGMAHAQISERVFEQVWEKTKPLETKRQPWWARLFEQWFIPRPTMVLALAVSLFAVGIAFFQWGGRSHGMLESLVKAQVDIHSMRSTNAPKNPREKEKTVNPHTIQDVVLMLNTQAVALDGLKLQLVAVPTNGGRVTELKSDLKIKHDGVHFKVAAKQTWLEGDAKSGYLAAVDMSTIEGSGLPDSFLDEISKIRDFQMEQLSGSQQLSVSKISGYDVLWIAPFKLQ